MKVILALCLVIGVSSALPDDWKRINEIKSTRLTWKAGPNHVANKGKEYVKRLLGAIIPKDIHNIPRYTPDVNGDLPDHFDSREAWPDCVSIRSVKDQSDCGSCWAVAGSAAMSDRICVASQGRVQVNISAEHLMTCCDSCGYGCQGGDPGAAWEWFKEHGIVTGGDYGSNEGCEPYEIAPCNNDPSFGEPPCPEEAPDTPQCYDRSCTNKHYKVRFQKDKHYGGSNFVLQNGESSIRREIMQNGPVEAAFSVYEDFMSYSSGVYQHVQGEMLGGHAVRVIGWGVENDTPYWLVVNSWNNKWGDNGLFKIARGTNECGIEDYVVAGIPKV